MRLLLLAVEAEGVEQRRQAGEGPGRSSGGAAAGRGRQAGAEDGELGLEIGEARVLRGQHLPLPGLQLVQRGHERALVRLALPPCLAAVPPCRLAAAAAATAAAALRCEREERGHGSDRRAHDSELGACAVEREHTMRLRR